MPFLIYSTMSPRGFWGMSLGSLWHPLGFIFVVLGIFSAPFWEPFTMFSMFFSPLICWLFFDSVLNRLVIKLNQSHKPVAPCFITSSDFFPHGMLLKVHCLTSPENVLRCPFAHFGNPFGSMLVVFDIFFSSILEPEKHPVVLMAWYVVEFMGRHLFWYLF